jgi:malonate decarboxylase beta subunit
MSALAPDNAAGSASVAPLFVQRRSFIELPARERARALCDPGTPRELLGPFDRVESPWLPLQGITPQADDGCIVMKGTVAAHPAVVLALEGAFQGGSIGEVSGAKIAAALDLARADHDRGTKTGAVLLLETGGVRLQEANLGLAAIAEILAAIVALRALAPVVCVTAGSVGCFGGMALAAGLASYLVMTREARLGLSGPEVIEQESGMDEIDATDRPLIWAITGGEHRYLTGTADLLVEDDIDQIVSAVHFCFQAGVPREHRSARADALRARIAALDPAAAWDHYELRRLWTRKECQA